MKNVILIKGKDYRGHGVIAVNGVEQTVEDNKAKELVATGFFKICGDVALEDDFVKTEDEPQNADNSKDSNDEENSDKPVEKMKGDELKSYAEKKGYDISNCIKVEEIRSLIIELDKKASVSE